MSKQETIKILKEIREKEIFSRYCEALDNAIEFMEKETDDETINNNPRI